MKRLLLILMVLTTLLSCQNGFSDSGRAFKNYMDIITKNKKESKKDIMGDYNDVEFINKYFNEVSYKILNVEENDNKSLITLEIKSPDIIDKLLELQKNSALKEAKNNGDKQEVLNIINKELIPVLENEKLKYIKKEKRVFMIKQDGNWIITNNIHGENGYFNLLLKDAFVNLF